MTWKKTWEVAEEFRPDTDYGVPISDAFAGRLSALRKGGRTGTDELAAFLQGSRTVARKTIALGARIGVLREVSVPSAFDFGDPKSMRSMDELNPGQVDPDRLCHMYGLWAAFNYLLGVSDRHGGNFVVSLRGDVLHSVDNETGPFDSAGEEVRPELVMVSVRRNIERFISGTDRAARIAILRRGFLDGWNRAVPRLHSLTRFDEKTMDLIRKRSLRIPKGCRKSSLHDTGQRPPGNPLTLSCRA